MKKAAIVLFGVMVLAGAALLACGEAPKVVQGTVVSYDAGSKALVISDDAAPHSQLTLSLESAEKGIDPVAGDIVRVAYHETTAGLKAMRVMNLSHQMK